MLQRNTPNTKVYCNVWSSSNESNNTTDCGQNTIKSTKIAADLRVKKLLIIFVCLISKSGNLSNFASHPTDLGSLGAQSIFLGNYPGVRRHPRPTDIGT